MKTSFQRLAGLALVLATFASSAVDAGPATALLHSTGDAHCQHIVDLLMRYGTSNNAHRMAVPFGNSLILGDSVGDLELVSVTMTDAGNDAAGPTIAVAIRNNSERHVTSFGVSVAAVLGRIHPLSPSKTCTVKKICAGETLEVQLQLPVECLAMGRSLHAGANVLAFNKLVVAIDSFDELVECNESNNIQVLDRTQIPVAVVVPTVTEESPPTPDAVVPSSPGSTGAAPGETQPIQAPTDPTVKATPSINDIDFDKLEVITK